MSSKTYSRKLKHQRLLQPKRFRRKIKQRQERRKRALQSVQSRHVERREQRKNLSKSSSENKRVSLALPVRFSLTENYEETLAFFEKLTEYVKRNHPVMLEQKDVQHISIDAIMYLIALFERFEGQRMSMDIAGNEPKDVKAAAIFRESGFYNFMTASPTNQSSSHVIPIYQGSKTRSEVVRELCRFVHNHFGWEIPHTSGIYTMLIEMMTNTIHHAQSVVASRNDSTWFVYARYDKEEEAVHFCFLDLGLGIPATVRQSFPERTRALIRKAIGHSMRHDVMLLESALEGQFRTRTKQKHRGRGLRSIIETYKRSEVSSLSIFSNRAAYTDGSMTHKDNPIDGTLFTWKVVKR